LVPGQFTPQIQAAISRLGSKMPFEEALEEVRDNRGIDLSEGTVRQTTYRHGQAAEALYQAEVERIEREAPTARAQPGKLMVSADGTLIPLVNGEWREVKNIAVGEVKSAWVASKGEIIVKTKKISYFSRSYRAREFERSALAELHHRGIDNAETVIAVNDGADWIQSFIDYHCPEAVRIIDFAHAQGYLAQAGKAVWGEGSPQYKQWYAAACHRLKHEPPQRSIANLRLLQQKVKTDEQAALVDGALHYFQKRKGMMDYAHFRQLGYPIGSGSVESGHKVVVHRRLKGAGMRWAPQHVDPILSLRNLVCNKRWEAGWQQIVAYHQQQRRETQRRSTPVTELPSSEPVTFASLKRKGLLPVDENLKPKENQQSTANRPAEDHPWRRGFWPTRESRRWH
jgi:hypothetical protein